MKIKIEIEVDTEIEQDLNTVEEIIYKLKDLLETQGDDEDAERSYYARRIDSRVD